MICTFNGVPRLSKTLESIVNQKVDPAVPWELIMVDNNSTDGTAAWCAAYLEQAEIKIHWRVIKEANPGLSNARKLGILEARYDYVLFCDDDNWLCSHYVDTAFNTLERNPEIGIVGGKGEPVFEIEQPSWFVNYSGSYAVGSKNTQSGYARNNSVYGAGMVLRKKLLLDLYAHQYDSLLSDRKGNDLVSGGDDELCLWYWKAGYKIYFEEKLEFKHDIPAGRLNFGYLEKRAAGKGKTEAIFAIYANVFKGQGKASWLLNKPGYYFHIFKRIILLGLLLIRPRTQSRTLSIALLRSSIQFRLENYNLLLTSYNQCRQLLAYLSKSR